ncbi:unnamed protein product [Parascedosporium putredinis]|uniref:C2H2-type domain-containing protein n=1 Tax=Parascedosporium putredinis TaxID=1442378 RepID=A0A9P1HCD3_9PEZI|nr:unnamed protein product [Parascedosporium putredinis]CAI8003166.1 unnamed protein product [Parascedosporium putredinis]
MIRSDFSSFGMNLTASEMYSLGPAGPSDHLSSPWVGMGDVQQHLSDFPGHTQGVDAEDYPLATYGAPTPHGTEMDFAEELRKQCASPIKRLQSRSPGMASKRRLTKSSAITKPPRLAPAPTSSRVPTLGLTENNGLAFQGTGSQFLDVNQPLFQDAEQTDNLSGQMYFQSMASLDLDINSSIPFGEITPMHVDPTHMQLDPDNASLTATSSPHSWTATFTPPQSPNADEAWYQASLASSESAGSSPEGYGMGQTYSLGQDLGIQGLASGDMTTIGHDDAFAVSNGASRRPKFEGETARDHHLYKTAVPKSDGLFHCPWEGTQDCHHKPEKLKCNYDKFVDSHLRPYRCKVDSCADARFSSTACLLRHEREAHRMHGHQAYNCTYAGCERSLDGKGFPRAWNLKDHMRRVHNDNGVGPIAGSQQRGGVVEDQAKARRKSKSSPVSSAGIRKSSKAMAADVETDRLQQALLEWDDHHKNLQATVQHLGKANEAETRKQMKKAQKLLDQLVTAYERVNTEPSASRRRSHGD